MDIYLIRHTQTAAEPGLCYGQTDVSLASSFADELSAVKGKVPQATAESFTVSSPLTRCLHLAGHLSKNVIIDPRLSELHFGDWEGRRFDEIEPDLLRHWTDHFVDTAPPNGESFTDLHQRLGGFWQDLIKQPHEQAFVVTHAGAIRALLAQVLGLPLANAFQFRIDLGSVHKLRHRNDYTYIDYLNR